jgi:ABC-type amino acid transport substrate-binding protein
MVLYLTHISVKGRKARPTVCRPPGLGRTLVAVTLCGGDPPAALVQVEVGPHGFHGSISSEQYGIGFKKGNDALKDQVQETLNAMFEDGTVAKIAENYTDSGVPGSLITK